jgi:hypothetical protein
MGQTTLLVVASLGVLGACRRDARPTTPARIPTPTVLVGACATPGRDGVVGASPRLDHADRDLNGDGVAEAIVVDRALCSPEGNCAWNVFLAPPRGSTECARFAGTFEGAVLEPLPSRGEDNMVDIRSYWHLHGDRVLLQAYRFQRGGYRLVDALVCARSRDDTLDCADNERVVEH